MTRRGWIALAMFAWPLGCAEPDRYDVVDSLGVRFGIEPHESGGFLFHEPKEAPLPCSNDEQTPIWGLAFGWMFELCSACDFELGWSTGPSLCRPLVCDGEDECPVINERVFECVNGICQDLEQAEDRVNVMTADLLCRHDAPRAVAGATPEFATRYAQLDCEGEGLAATCELPLPEGCLRP